METVHNSKGIANYDDRYCGFTYSYNRIQLDDLKKQIRKTHIFVPYDYEEIERNGYEYVIKQVQFYKKPNLTIKKISSSKCFYCQAPIHKMDTKIDYRKYMCLKCSEQFTSCIDCSNIVSYSDKCNECGMCFCPLHYDSHQCDPNN